MDERDERDRTLKKRQPSYLRRKIKGKILFAKALCQKVEKNNTQFGMFNDTLHLHLQVLMVGLLCGCYGRSFSTTTSCYNRHLAARCTATHLVAVVDTALDWMPVPHPPQCQSYPLQSTDSVNKSAI